MTSSRLYEPDKYWSALQAALLMVFALVPLALTFKVEQRIALETLSIAIVPPPSASPPQINPEQIQREQEEIRAREAERFRKREAEIARRRTKEREEQLEQERQQQAEQERIKREQEERRAAEEQAKAAQEKLAAAQKRKETAELKRVEEEHERIAKELREQELAKQQEAEQREAARQARIKAENNQRIIGRFTNGIIKQVQRYLTNPEGVASNLRVRIFIQIGPDGHLLDKPQVTDKSGNTVYDKVVLRAILRASEQGFALPDDSELRAIFQETYLTITPQL